MAASAASGTAVTCNIITVLVSQDSSVFYNREYVDQRLSCGLHAQLWVQHRCVQTVVHEPDS